MSKFLGTFYPVRPYQSLDIYCLDYLDTEKYPGLDKNSHDYISTLMNVCEEVKRGEHCDRKIYHYNNSAVYMGEADDIFEFMTDFRAALSDARKEQ